MLILENLAVDSIQDLAVACATCKRFNRLANRGLWDIALHTLYERFVPPCPPEDVQFHIQHFTQITHMADILLEQFRVNKTIQYPVDALSLYLSSHFPQHNLGNAAFQKICAAAIHKLVLRRFSVACRTQTMFCYNKFIHQEPQPHLLLCQNHISHRPLTDIDPPLTVFVVTNWPITPTLQTSVSIPQGGATNLHTYIASFKLPLLVLQERFPQQIEAIQDLINATLLASNFGSEMPPSRHFALSGKPLTESARSLPYANILPITLRQILHRDHDLMEAIMSYRRDTLLVITC
ncbi:hypothetical protein K474DRAFT_1703943 [Panus rudis PR-1116 ss-1]|nr:hypothetical protein K474DRAFT_1703943 [Panus rudis PR-1116 ss-1]